MAIVVHGGSGSPYAWRVQLALEVKEVGYELRTLSFSERQHKAPGFLALNPRGKVPVLEHDGYVLTESIAILQYLDAAFPEPPLYGRSPAERGRVAEAVASVQAYLEPLAPRIYRPIFWSTGPVDPEQLEAPAAELHDELRRVEARVAAEGWLANGSLSAADLALYPLLQLLIRAATRPQAARLVLGLTPLGERYPGLAGWCARVEALPNFGRTWPSHWRDAPS